MKYKEKVKKKISIITACLIFLFVAILSIVTIKSINKTNALENSEYRTITLKINFDINDDGYINIFSEGELMVIESDKITFSEKVISENIGNKLFLYNEHDDVHYTIVYSIKLKPEDKYLLFQDSSLVFDEMTSDNSEIVYIYNNEGKNSMLFFNNEVSYGIKISDDQDEYEINISDRKDFIDVQIDASDVEEEFNYFISSIIANNRVIYLDGVNLSDKIFHLEVPYLEFEEFGLIMQNAELPTNKYKIVEDGIELDEILTDYSNVDYYGYFNFDKKVWYKKINKDNLKDKYNLKIVKRYEEVGKEVTLKYNANIDKNEEDIEIPKSEVKLISDSVVEFTISNMIPKRNGYKFLGWSTEKGINKVDYNPGEKISISEDKILYAVWEVDKLFTNKYGSYKVIHEYYTKDRDGNITLEDKVISDVANDIEVGKKVGISNDKEKVDIEISKELNHVVNDVEYNYEYLESSKNIVIEEDIEKDIIVKYVRNISDKDTNSNVDTSDINIWLYVVVFIVAIVAIVVIVIVVIFIKRKNK